MMIWGEGKLRVLSFGWVNRGHPTGGLFGGDDTWVNSNSYGTGIETRFWLVFWCF
jgi:hypothetical protein